MRNIINLSIPQVVYPRKEDLNGFFNLLTAPHLSLNDREQLETSITMNEVIFAIDSLKFNRVMEVDGFSTEFYKV